MISNKEIVELKIIIKEAFEDMTEVGADSLGIYNYIRYCNKDFGSDMYIYQDIPVTDNTELQHGYLTIVLYELLTREMDVSNDLRKLYLDNRNQYFIPFLDKEKKYIDNVLKE